MAIEYLTASFPFAVPPAPTFRVINQTELPLISRLIGHGCRCRLHKCRINRLIQFTYACSVRMQAQHVAQWITFWLGQISARHR